MMAGKMSVIQRVFTAKTMQKDESQQSVNFVEDGEVIDVDLAVLRAQGHNAELERSFSWIGATGLAFSITNSWLSYASCFGIVLALGGAQTAVFGVILSAAAQWIVLLGLAELCSAMPSSGGQYHFTYIIAPETTRNFGAYMVGIINVIAWWVTTSSGAIYTAISAFGIFTFWYPEFAAERWQVYLCYLLVIILTLLPVLLVPHKHIDQLTKTSMFLSLVGFAMVTIVCLVMSRNQYRPGPFITSNRGISGWPAGVGWLMSIGVGEYGFAGTGAVTHIAEELPRPGRRIPQVINLTMVIGVSTAVPWILAMTFCIQDLEAIQTSSLPSLELFYQATESKAVASFLQAYLTFLYYTCVPSQWITCSRITWAFARDHGLPYSDYWKVVNKKFEFPVRTTFLSAAFCAIYGLIYVASTAAYNSIINTAILMLNLTFTVPQAILLVNGRSRLPERPFSLGRFGYFVNGFSVVWLIISGVFFCFPNSNPTSLGSMNYNSVVLTGIVTLVALLYIERRKKFSGPSINKEDLNIRNVSIVQ